MNGKTIFFLKVIIVCVCFYLVYIFVSKAFVSPPLTLIKDNSKSLPHKLYLGYMNKVSPKRRDYVLINHEKFNFPLIKRVIGIAGDKIFINDSKLYINDKYFGKVLKESPILKKQLKEIQVKTIPRGYFFVGGTHEHSFDSRYDDFGLINLNDIKAKLWPVY